MSTRTIARLTTSILLLLEVCSTGCSTRMGSGMLARPMHETPKSTVKSSPSSAFRPETIGRIAVIGLGKEEEGIRVIEDGMTEELLAKGYRLATRRDIERVFEELRLQRATNALTEQEVASLGRKLGVQALLIVNPWEWDVTRCITRHVHYLGTSEPKYFYAAKVGIAARLVALDAEILWSGSAAEEQDVDSQPTPKAFLRNAASSLGAAFPKAQR